MWVSALETTWRQANDERTNSMKWLLQFRQRSELMKRRGRGKEGGRARHAGKGTRASRCWMLAPKTTRIITERKWHKFAITSRNNKKKVCTTICFRNTQIPPANGASKTLVPYLGSATVTAITVNNSEKIASASSTFVRNWENEIIDFHVSMGAFLAGWQWQHKWAVWHVAELRWAQTSWAKSHKVVTFRNAFTRGTGEGGWQWRSRNKGRNQKLFKNGLAHTLLMREL